MHALGRLAATALVSISLVGCSAGPRTHQSQPQHTDRSRHAASILEAAFNGLPGATRLTAPGSAARRWVEIEQVERAAYVNNGDSSLLKSYSVGPAGHGRFKVRPYQGEPFQAGGLRFNQHGRVVTFAGLGDTITKHHASSTVHQVRYLLVGAVHNSSSLTVALKVTAGRVPVVLDAYPTYVAPDGLQYKAEDSEVPSDALQPAASSYAVYYFPSAARAGGTLHLESYLVDHAMHPNAAHLSVR
jgi:hypothetical protein